MPMPVLRCPDGTVRRSLSIASIPVLMLLAEPTSVVAQNAAFRIGTDFPLRYTAGITFNPYGRVSIQGNAGILTDPYDGILLDYISLLEVDEDALDLAGRVFEQGNIFDIGTNLNIGRGYVGVFGQVIRLRGNGAPVELVEEFLDIDLSPYYSSVPNRAMNLRSTIYQAGARLGSRFIVADPDLELHVEFSFSVNLDSENSFSSDIPFPEFIHDRFDRDLRDAYRDYLYVPSIGAFLVYNFWW